jgi:hypothetical protein
MAVGRACISIFCLLFLYVFMTFCEYNITYSLKHQDKKTFTAYMRMYRKYVFIAPLDFRIRWLMRRALMTSHQLLVRIHQLHTCY